VVVADAGGTELSILDASTRLLLWRQALPNFLIEKYSIQTSTGFTRVVITVHDVSDRPQYSEPCVGRVTRRRPAPRIDLRDLLDDADAEQLVPVQRRATLRMEKLINSTDTLQLFGICSGARRPRSERLGRHAPHRAAPAEFRAAQGSAHGVQGSHDRLRVVWPG